MVSQMGSISSAFYVSAVGLAPTPMSAEALLARVSDSDDWPEASVHPSDADFPRLGIEFHPRAGYSILCHEDERSLGFLAATQATTTAPTVPVNLGGQVIERWPSELFLSEAAATAILQHFFESGRQHPAFAWIRLDKLEREHLHEGPGLSEFWKALTSQHPPA
jgi:hypothetical protein